MNNFGGRCVEVVQRGRCLQQVTENESGASLRCYYHDKVAQGLCDTADSIVIYEDEDD